MRRARRVAGAERIAPRKTIIVAAAVALLLAGCGSSSTPESTTPEPKPARPDGFFGVDPGVPPDSRDFQDMAKAGIETVRNGLSWSAVQPGFAPYRWTSTDAMVGGLAANGIGLLPVLAGTPGWVTDAGTTPPVFGGPHAKQAWTAFLKAAVDRYGPKGSFWKPSPDGGPSPFHTVCRCDADPVPITSWQVWNEPSLIKYFTPNTSIAKYAELLRISHDAIKSQDAHAQIVLAGVPGYGGNGLNAWRYLDELFRRPGVNKDFDVVALHPYAENVDQLRVEIEKVRAVMADSGNAAKPLWVTELGWGSAPPDRFGFNKAIEGQKRLLTRAFRLLSREGTKWHLERVYWFRWRDPPASAETPCSFCGSAGLLRNNRKPKPAYHAFTRFTHHEQGDR
jgi:Glycosyl hydrolase catalytic core